MPGTTDETSTLSDLAAPGYVLGGSDVAISAKVHDTGTVHRDFRGADRLVVSVDGTDTLFPDFTVMRGSTREISTMWNPPLMCVCHPTLGFANADGSRQSATVRVVVFPLHLVAFTLGGLLLLAVAVIIGRRWYRATVHRAAARLHPRTGIDHA